VKAYNFRGERDVRIYKKNPIKLLNLMAEKE
jgi:hypothetical protein